MAPALVVVILHPGACIDPVRPSQGLNLNAIWSSPVTETAYGGFHGYWPTNLYAGGLRLPTCRPAVLPAIAWARLPTCALTTDAPWPARPAANPNFGTADDLRHMLKTLASNGFYNILDVVMNHAGYGASIHQPAFNPFAKD